jgi:hypothetical protein
MATMNLKPIMIAGFFGFALSGCKPEGPPPDLIKTQREGLTKARAVEGQLQQQAEEQKSAIDAAQK